MSDPGASPSSIPVPAPGPAGPDTVSPGGRNWQDITAGALFVVPALAGLAASFSYPMGSALQMGPGYYPALVFGLLAALGAVILAKGLRQEGTGAIAWSWRPLALILGGLVVFALAASTLGFVLSSLAMTLLATAATPGLSLTARLVLAGVITAFCWAVFLLGLGVLIPTWPDLAP